MVDGLKLYESLLDDKEVKKLVSLANDLRAAGKRGQSQGKFIGKFSLILLYKHRCLSLLFLRIECYVHSYNLN